MHIAVRPKACPSCQPAYGPLIMLDPRPGRPPAKPAPPIPAPVNRELLNTLDLINSTRVSLMHTAHRGFQCVDGLSMPCRVR